MNLDQLPDAEEEDEDDEDDYYYRYKPKKPTHEWVFRDEFGNSRFTHEGDTIVPGAGVRWKHWHDHEAEARAAAAAVVADGSASSSTALTEIKEDDEEELPWQVIAILDVETLQDLMYSSQYHKRKVNEAKAGKNAPAPAQASLECSTAPGRWLFRVVAPAGVYLHLEASELSEEVGSRKCGEYVRGLEVSEGGEWLRLESVEDTDRRSYKRFDANRHKFYNAEHARREVWVRICKERILGCEGAVYLEEVPAAETAVVDMKGVGDLSALAAAAAEEEEAAAAGLKGPAADAEDGGGEEEDEDAAAKKKQKQIVGRVRYEEDADGGSGMTGDFFDKPFVPRMDDGSGSSSDPDATAAASEAASEAALEGVTSRSVFVMSGQWGVPMGAAVVVSGLRSRAGMQYNGLTGVVVSTLENDGRQGVRLNAPFSGKVLSCKPSNLSFCEEDDDEEDPEEEEDVADNKQDELIVRAARLLGLTLTQIQMDDKISRKKDKDATTAAAAAEQGAWGFAGLTPRSRVGTALRSVLRDHAQSVSPTVCDGAREAADLLLSAITRAESTAAAEKSAAAGEVTLQDAEEGEDADNNNNTTTTTTTATTNKKEEEERAPHVLVRSGALGGRAAAAVMSAFSSLSSGERGAGLQALRDILRDEVRRSRAARDSLFENAGEDSEGRDELLLRLALVEALLESRREAEALEEARYAARFYEEIASTTACPAVTLLLGRCLLRLGMRAEGLSTLEDTERLAAVSSTTTSTTTCTTTTAGVVAAVADWLHPIWAWGNREAEQLLRVHRAAEQCREAAVETYARGAFLDAAALYGRALALLQAGFSEDKRGKATALADRAGCLRRARKLDEAVADLDAALRLFPRYARALFRRATCLLEGGKAAEAVEGFKALYRVDRDWPMLSEWLVRAFSLQKRQAKGYRKSSGSDDDEEEEEEYNSYDDPAYPKGKKGGGASTAEADGAAPLSDADKIAREVDHYTVLGVTTDATEKQLKTAYRLRSLKFHPDRKEGHTAAFQRIAEAYEVLSDDDKRRNYDEGVDIKVKRGRRDEDDDSDDSEEEHKTSMREEVEREFYPERYSFWPFGDPFIYKRKREAQKRAKQGRPAWHDEDY